jgi:hypothetical protein
MDYRPGKTISFIVLDADGADVKTKIPPKDLSVIDKGYERIKNNVGKRAKKIF